MSSINQNVRGAIIQATKLKTNTVIVQTVIVLVVLLLYSSGTRNLVLIGTLLASGITLINPHIGFSLYIVTAFSSTFFQAIEGVSASRIVGLAMLLAYAVRLKLYIKKSTVKVILMIGLMLGWSVFSLIYSRDPSGSIDALSVLGLNLAVSVAIILGRHVKEKDMMKLTGYSMACMLLFVFLFLAREKMVTVGLTGISIGMKRLTLSSQVNPNEFGRSVAQFSIYLLGYLVVASTSRILEKLIFGVAYILGLILLAGSGSRSGTLSLIICTVLVAWFGARHLRLSKKIAWSIFGIAISLLVVLLVIFEQPTLANRFSIHYIMETHGARRFILWNIYAREVIPQHFLLGNGIGGTNEVAALGKVTSALSYQKPSHNMILSLMAELGIIGLLIFGGSFMITVLHGYHLSRAQPMAFPIFAVFILSLIMGIGEPMFFSKIFWIAFSLIWRFEAAGQVEGEQYARA